MLMGLQCCRGREGTWLQLVHLVPFDTYARSIVYHLQVSWLV